MRLVKLNRSISTGREQKMPLYVILHFNLDARNAKTANILISNRNIRIAKYKSSQIWKDFYHNGK